MQTLDGRPVFAIVNGIPITSPRIKDMDRIIEEGLQIKACTLRHHPEYCLNCDGIKICYPLGYYYASRPIC